MAKMIAQFRSFRVRTLKTDATMSVKPECVFDGKVDVDMMKFADYLGFDLSIKDRWTGRIYEQ